MSLIIKSRTYRVLIILGLIVFGLDLIFLKGIYARWIISTPFKRIASYYCNSNKWLPCSRWYSVAIAIHPDSRIQRSNRGVAYLQLGRYSEAIADFDKVLESDPNSPRAFSLRAEAYSHIINISSAAAQVARTGLGAEYSKAPLYDGQLYELLKTGDKKKTLAFLDQLARNIGEDWRISAYRGILNWDAGRYNDAAWLLGSNFQKFRPKDFYIAPNSQNVVCNIEKYIDPVVFKYIDLLAQGDMYTINLLRGVTLRQFGCMDMEYFNKAIAINPSDPRAYSARAEAYLFMGDRQAIDDADKAISLNKADALAYLVRSCARRSEKKYKEFAEDYAKAISLGLYYAVTPPYIADHVEYLAGGDKKAMAESLANSSAMCKRNDSWACMFNKDLLKAQTGTTRRDAAPPVADIKPRPYTPSKLLSEIMEFRKNTDGPNKVRYWTTLGDMEKKLAKEIEKEIMENRIICETLFPASIRYQYGVYPLIRALNLKDNALVQYLLDNERCFNVYYEEGGFTVEALTETRLQPLWELPEGRAAILKEAAGNLELWLKSFCLTEDESCEYGASQKYVNEEILRILEKFKNTELNKESLKILDLYESKLSSYTISNWGMPIKPGQKTPPEVIAGISNSLAKVKALRKQYSSKAN